MMTLRITAFCTFALIWGATDASAAPLPSPAPQAAATSSPEAEDRRLTAFLDAAFDARTKLSPESLTALGIKTDYDRLDDYTDAGAKAAQNLLDRQVADMKAAFDPARLGPSGRLSYQLFADLAEQARLRSRWRSHIYPVTNSASPTGDIPVFLINMHRIDNASDARAYIARLKDTERALGEIAAQVRSQAAHGVIPPKFVFEPVIADAKAVITGAPFDDGPDSALFADFKKKIAPLGIGQDEKDRLVADASAALTGPLREGYRAMIAALAEVSAKATGNDGVWRLPDGDAFYADQLRYYTTTDLPAEQIHQKGLAEVARIQAEMETIKGRTGFKGTLRQFFAFVKTDPRFHYPNTADGRQAYLDDARKIVAQAMDAAPGYFRYLPRARLDVRAVEPWRQETAPVAFYSGPAPDGSRPGVYYVNLADMGQVLKPQIEGITYHEAAPGHHFQIAFAQEIAGMPKFRRFGYYGAYTEGWGLYAEKLGKEMGFYQDPYSDFGRLSLELWRACRLVTDTGLHAKKWTREQAIDYFEKNTLLSDRDAKKEVERYLNWPGQAASYKMGELKILELRAKARQILGRAFDIRDFHQAVLGNGAMPLDVLEEQVNAYIAAKR